MDIAKYAATAESYDPLSVSQISQFFERHESTTKDDCNRMAANILKSTVSPTPIQGAQSYTVTADSSLIPKVIQFRSLELNIELIEYARRSYNGFVPYCEYYGMLGDVHMYVWDLVPGPAFCRVRHQFLTPGMQHRLRRTVQDFARSVKIWVSRRRLHADQKTRFSASAWINKPVITQPCGSLEAYSRTLDQISQGLPERILRKLNEARQGLPLLFRPEYPCAVQHGDFLENNFHVDEVTGHITGVVDWADAMIAPFGVSLGGLETILGVQTSKAWYCHPNHIELREHFWDTFYGLIGPISADDRRSIEVARLFGLFQTHGFDAGDARIAYLEVLCML
jgi:hypothetical protein